jgi:hypothetical protein
MKEINVVALGVYRHVAVSMDKTFENTPYRMAAVLDLKSSPDAFTYTPHNLGVIFHTLVPRPQVLITGAAISEAMTNESIGVWKLYIEHTGAEDTLIINVSYLKNEELIKIVLMNLASSRASC